MKHEQPAINTALVQRLRRVAACYEMTADKMINIILAVGLEELDGCEDDLTICVPVTCPGDVD